MENSLAIWAVVCFVVAMTLFFLEVFIPSGGMLGLFAMISMVTGVICLFRIDTTLGLISAMVSLISLPIGIGLALKIWPSTPVAKWLTLQPLEKKHRENTHKTPNLPIGATGKVLSDLRPIGACQINQKRVECLAISGMIRAGEQVQVISCDGMQIKVKLADEA